METLRIMRSFVFILSACMALCGIVHAYDNVYAHPMINNLALSYFNDKIKPDDPYLSGTTFSGKPASGEDWSMRLGDPQTKVPSDGIVAVKRAKPLDEWIIDGGFSMDEPEWWQCLRHFYDPKNPSTPYLTDHQSWVPKFAAIAVSVNQTWGRNILDVLDYAKNPKISAVEWAFDQSTGYQYSYPYAKMYLTKALASDDRNNEYYGKAWRAVGETMHMIADMTVPAHVRNDAHGLPIDRDPYEESVTGGTVKNYYEKYSYAYKKLNYNQDLSGMMKDIAVFTNENFIALDTNDNYALPDLSKEPRSDGYIHGSIDGFDYPVARYMSTLDRVLEIHAYPNALTYYPALDQKVLAAQKSILIPTAVRGSAAVLDRFLPRFQVFGEIKTSQEVQSNRPVTLYYLDGEIVQKGNTAEWPGKLTIRNGASIVNSATKTKVTIPVDKTKGDNLNDFRYQFKPSDVGAKAGDRIYIEYDLGGYVIRSADIEIPEEYPTPTTTPATVKTTRTTAPVKTTLTPKPTTVPAAVKTTIADEKVYDETYCSKYEQIEIMNGDSEICRYTIGNYWKSLDYIAERERTSRDYVSGGGKAIDVAGLVNWRNKYKGCGCCKYFTSADANTFGQSMLDHYNSFTPYLCG